MGNCGRGMTKEEKRKNEQLDALMKAELQRDALKLKLLLLGTAESGKSTIFKQMKFLYSSRHGFTDDERKGYVTTIHQNIFHDMQALLKAALELELLDNSKSDAVDEFETWDKNREMKQTEKDVLLSLWRHPVFVNLWNNRGEKKMQALDALEYYMDNIERITSPGYMPTVPDILHSRVRTTGIVEGHFRMGGLAFEVYDVGGQRNERRNWLHSFENVSSVIFVAAISEYNQVLFEGELRNRQDEAITLFGQLLKKEFFLNTPFILFLNKKDLLRKKLPKIPFSTENRNVDFGGPHCDPRKTYSTDGSDAEFESCYVAVCDYLRRKYLDQQTGPAPISYHFTNSTDSDNINVVMKSCKDYILSRSWRLSGLISTNLT